jgi:hypothetical protein
MRIRGSVEMDLSIETSVSVAAHSTLFSMVPINFSGVLSSFEKFGCLLDGQVDPAFVLFVAFFSMETW